MPETEEIPDIVRENNEGPFTRGWVVWALDTLRRGNKDEADAMLVKALKGDKY